MRCQISREFSCFHHTYISSTAISYIIMSVIASHLLTELLQVHGHHKNQNHPLLLPYSFPIYTAFFYSFFVIWHRDYGLRSIWDSLDYLPMALTCWSHLQFLLHSTSPFKYSPQFDHALVLLRINMIFLLFIWISLDGFSVNSAVTVIPCVFFRVLINSVYFLFFTSSLSGKD